MMCLNHSCDPNVGLRGDITFVAMRDILSGEELTVDYAMMDNGSSVFSCVCASSCCRREITGKDWMKKEIQEKYRGYFSAYIESLITRLPPQKASFAVIYQIYIKSGRELEYQEQWNKIAAYFVKHRGALGSCLHRTSDGSWLAYSRWPSKEMRDASWGGNALFEEFPQEIQKTVIQLKDCMDLERKIPEVCMEIVDDLLSL